MCIRQNENEMKCVNCKKYKISKIIVFLTIKNCYFTQRRVTNVQFPYAFYLLGTGSGATYFYSSCSRLFFGAAPALVFSLKRLWLQEAKNIWLLPAPAPQP